ncbi:hypothetical protein [Metasolibacillus sp. FSL K6-0083]|uniref:hypothetical protein n=1 Tax=Metasolibacillus sp. FSL K6-0083 TaxID=2921416 RepID=UPI000A8240BA
MQKYEMSANRARQVADKEGPHANKIQQATTNAETPIESRQTPIETDHPQPSQSNKKC